MLIISSKKFDKRYSKLKTGEQRRVDLAIQKFSINPFDPTLRNHPLIGKFTGLRSISAGGDLRIIFREKDNYIEVLLITVGSHNQVY